MEKKDLSGTNLFSSPSFSPLGCERVKRRKKFLPGAKRGGGKKVFLAFGLACFPQTLETPERKCSYNTGFGRKDVVKRAYIRTYKPSYQIKWTNSQCHIKNRQWKKQRWAKCSSYSLLVSFTRVIPLPDSCSSSSSIQISRPFSTLFASGLCQPPYPSGMILTHPLGTIFYNFWHI